VKDYNSTVRIKNLYNEFVAGALYKDISTGSGQKFSFIKHEDVLALYRFNKQIISLMERFYPEHKEVWSKNIGVFVKDYNATVRIKNMYNEFVAGALYKDISTGSGLKFSFIKYEDVLAAYRFNKQIISLMERFYPEHKEV